jgi:hypothetical protein
MIRLVDKPNTTPPDDDYPFGNIKDNPGNRTGTPLNKLVHADFHQFFEKMFDQSGLVANGLPDNDYNGFQLFEALLAVTNGGYRVKVIPIGAWDMDNTLAINVPLGPYGLDVTKVKFVDIMIVGDPNIVTGASISAPLLMGGYYLWNDQDNRIDMFCTNGGPFDQGEFGDPVNNRGYMRIYYLP